MADVIPFGNFRRRSKEDTPELDTEVANRLIDPFETNYMGVLRTNDPVLLEKSASGNVQVYRDLKRDGKVFSGLQKRELALVGFPYQVEPIVSGDSGTADAAKVMAILKQCSFDQVTRGLLGANLAGISYAEIVWTVRDSLIVPDRIVQRSPRRFIFKQVDPNMPPDLRLLTRENMLDGIPLPGRKFIVHRVNAEDDNPYGTGLGQQLYWPVFFKRKGVVAWNKFVDRFGSPTAWGKYPKNASQRERSTLLAALQALSQDGCVTTPEGMSIELLESKLTGGVTTQQELCLYMDDWISEVILGQEPSKKGGGAVAAASKEREDVRLDLIQADSDLLSDTLNSTLIKWICEFNGFAPCMVYRKTVKETDKKAQSETDKNVSSMGFKPSLDYVRSNYGEGWEDAPQNGNTNAANAPSANFAEGGQIVRDQVQIDDALKQFKLADLSKAALALWEPVLQAIEGASSFEEALAAAEAAFPKMDPTDLQGMLANAMFNAQTFGQVTASALH
jgi:phage gp29-like protein